MSFYGKQKRVNSSPFIFDKIYPNRVEMEAQKTTDNIYIGRYVLVKYTTKYTDESKTKLEDFNKYSESSYENISLTADNYRPNCYYCLSSTEPGQYVLDDNPTFRSGVQYFVLHKIISEDYQNNAAVDMTEYQDTYDATIWQKIYTAANGENEPSEKYILIAEANAAVPRLELDVISPKYYLEFNGVNVENEEEWYQPKVLPDASSEDAYTFQMPNVLHLDVGKMGEDFYAKDLIANPAEKVLIKKPDANSTGIETTTNKEEALSHEEMLSPDHNYMKWTNMRYNGDGELIPANSLGDIDGKKLETQLYAFGQLISDLYDALYGAPKDGNAGLRPFYTADLSQVMSQYDKGLVGILSSLATDSKGDGSEDLYSRTLQPGMYYYFITKWNDASEDPDNFIENIPEVIGSKAQGPANAHYWLDFNNYAQNDNAATCLKNSGW